MTIQRNVIIEFLDDHWHKTKAGAAIRCIVDQPGDSSPDYLIRKLEELRNAYIAKLDALSDDQLLSVLGEALDEQEQARPFHQPGTDADFEHFGRCPFLTVPEAVALSLGKDPRVVNWLMVQPHLGRSRFAQDFANRLDLLDRAVKWHELPERFSPLTFLTWVHQYKIAVPTEFIERTFVRGEPIKYWHDLCL